MHELLYSDLLQVLVHTVHEFGVLQGVETDGFLDVFSCVELRRGENAFIVCPEEGRSLADVLRGGMEGNAKITLGNHSCIVCNEPAQYHNAWSIKFLSHYIPATHNRLL